MLDMDRRTRKTTTNFMQGKNLMANGCRTWVKWRAIYQPGPMRARAAKRKAVIQEV
jgi:hypothetical protein